MPLLTRLGVASYVASHGKVETDRPAATNWRKKQLLSDGWIRKPTAHLLLVEMVGSILDSSPKENR